ncbi:cytidine deaminase [Candidatus Poribacteria bacterium]|nr:cytidine deaminase [Candidatus Poribacteria bacterium]
MERPSWDDYFMEITHLVSKRSTCLRRHVGAVIVRDKRILSTGYNGAPRGLPHCAETGCTREKMGVPSGQKQELCRGLHAEQNAIIQAALFGAGIEGSDIYTVTQPCVVCAKMIINAGIKRVVFEEAYPDPLGESMLREAGVGLVNIKDIRKMEDVDET